MEKHVIVIIIVAITCVCALGQKCENVELSRFRSTEIEQFNYRKTSQGQILVDSSLKVFSFFFFFILALYLFHVNFLLIAFFF